MKPEELLAMKRPAAERPAPASAETPAPPIGFDAADEREMKAVERALANEAPVSVVTAMADDNLELAIKEAHLEPASAQELLNQFAPLMAEAKKLANMAKGLTVTAADQLTEMKLARQLRLAFRAVRVESEKLRVKLKADSVRRGKAIDGVHHVIEYLITPIETRLDEAEKFAERAEAKAKEKLKADREELLRPYGIATEFYALGTMPEENFTRLLEDTRRSHAAKVEEKIRLEKERVEKEKADAKAAICRERIASLEEQGAAISDEEGRCRIDFAAGVARITRYEWIGDLDDQDFTEILDLARQRLAAANEVKRKAKEDEDRKAKAERDRLQREKDEADKKTADAQAAQKKAEKALADRKKADADKALADQKAKAKAARAPDKAKFLAIAEAVRIIFIPQMTTEDGQKYALEVRDLLDETADNIQRGANDHL